jgi:hypothetical protein
MSSTHLRPCTDRTQRPDKGRIWRSDLRKSGRARTVHWSIPPIPTQSRVEPLFTIHHMRSLNALAYLISKENVRLCRNEKRWRRRGHLRLRVGRQVSQPLKRITEERLHAVKMAPSWQYFILELCNELFHHCGEVGEYNSMDILTIHICTGSVGLKRGGFQRTARNTG